MNQAALYQRANSVQRRDAKEIIKEFSPLIQWRLDGQDTLLDIGCGSGDVTMDFILPIMPKNFKRLIGSDLSGAMVRHARETYGVHQQSRISFIQMDITTNILENPEWDIQATFDHITSFYCLHWVQNQKKAVENIYNLLCPEGDCLLVFLASNPIFDAYKKLAAMPKWSSYMKDVHKCISPYQYSKNPGAEFGELVFNAGFVECSIEVRDQIFVYEGIELLRKNVKAVNPFTDRMSSELHEEFLDDFVLMVTQMGLGEKMLNMNDMSFITPYKLMVVYARK